MSRCSWHPRLASRKIWTNFSPSSRIARRPSTIKWLTPQQFADRFGLSQNDLNKVTGWLKSEGFQILSVGGGHNSIIFSGTAAQAQHAFGAEIHNYNVNGEAHVANSTPVMIPNALNGIVSSVMGLHDFRPQPAYRSRVVGQSRIGHPEYYDSHYIWPNFLAPGDIATIYNVKSVIHRLTRDRRHRPNASHCGTD